MKLIYLLFITSFCLIASCASLPSNVLSSQTESKRRQDSSQFEEKQLEFERNRRIWRESKISDYEMVIEGEYGMQVPEKPVVIRVKASQSEFIKALKGKQEPAFAFVYKEAGCDTVEGLFERAALLLQKRNLKNLKIEYDSALGYPKEIGVYTGQDDGEFTRVKSLKIIK